MKQASDLLSRKNGYDLEEAVRLASDMYYELSSRHPFWDGSGRTTKMFRDWLLISLGVGPPIFTTDHDWELSKEEMFRYTLKACLYKNTKAHFQQAEVRARPTRLLDVANGIINASEYFSLFYPSSVNRVCTKIY